MMNTSIILLLFGVVGSTFGYYVQREGPYNTGPNDPYSVEVNPYYQQQEPAQRLFWDKGSNQVGGAGWWSTITNKFPILGNMFGRLELPEQYGAPGQPSFQYGVPSQQLSPQYGAPPVRYQPQYYQSPPVYQRQPNQFIPSGRDVGFTDDAVIVTPPHVPAFPPAPAPAPVPVPAPSPEPSPGYRYDKPQYRLDLPQK